MFADLNIDIGDENRLLRWIEVILVSEVDSFFLDWIEEIRATSLDNAKSQVW